MQIHELNQYEGRPASTDLLAIDTGDETFKIEVAYIGVTDNMTKAEALAGTETESRVLQPSVFKEAVEELAGAVADTKLAKVLVISIGSFSTLPKTISDERITSDMVVLNYELGTPASQTADWTVTTANGSLTVSGTNAIDGSTTLKLYLAKS